MNSGLGIDLTCRGVRPTLRTDRAEGRGACGHSRRVLRGHGLRRALNRTVYCGGRCDVDPVREPLAPAPTYRDDQLEPRVAARASGHHAWRRDQDHRHGGGVLGNRKLRKLWSWLVGSAFVNVQCLPFLLFF